MIVSAHVVGGHTAYCLRCADEERQRLVSGDDAGWDWRDIKKAAALPFGSVVVRLDVEPGGRASPRLVCLRHAEVIRDELSMRILEADAMINKEATENG